MAILTGVGGLAVVFGLETRFGNHGGVGQAAAVGAALTLEKIPFNGVRAYEELKRLCAIGPRPSGSAGMAAQQKLLVEHFRRLGVPVEFQRFRARHPQTGNFVPMANLMVRWHPDRKDRILLCAHYDTLPFPLLDPENPQGVFVGANDNAGGVALLMELGRNMTGLGNRYGVDFVFLDGEEFIFREGEPMFLGAEYFARQYAAEQARQKPAYRYRWGVLLDMIGDADLRIPRERNGLWWRDTRPLVADIWAVATRLGIHEFAKEQGEEINDDHVVLHNIGRIPCIDLIDFDYPAWHTRADTPERCSPLSLAKVGWVVLEWLKEVK